MSALLDALYHSGLAEWLRDARWGYALVNASHIFGIALLIGAIVPLNLRLLGCWRSMPLEALARVLVPVATTGLALAVATGSMLFVSRAPEYAALGLFRIKMALLFAAVLHALWIRLGGWRRSFDQLRAIGLFSLLVWPAVLLCGRLLAFVEP